jgi:molybdenum cofactor biosynthesis enzyme MoaA
MYFNTRQKLNLARSLITKTSPAYIQYYLTARCDLACEQCNIIHAQADAEEMNLDEIREMARNLSKIGVCIVLLIGGEPFIRKDLPKIVKAFTDVNIHVRLQTNGLASTEALLKCVEAGAHDISISLDTLDETLQDTINVSSRHSWGRAVETIAKVNQVFPKNGTGFFGTVLMPRNIDHIEDIIRFATAIGWWVSLVPVHITGPDNPRGFRQIDDNGVCTFTPDQLPRVKQVLQQVKDLRRQKFNVYDSDEYLDDMYNFLANQPLRWRLRNGGICDSPNLYFAIEPDGSISPCCDYKLETKFKCYDESFPKYFWSGKIHREVYTYTRRCSGCMYGSYPEISVSARFLVPQIKRFLFFNTKSEGLLKKIPAEEMKQIARDILHNKHSEKPQV